MFLFIGIAHRTKIEGKGKCLKFTPHRTKCADCQKNRKVIFHFSLTLGEYSPDWLLPGASGPELKIFVAGKHAEDLLGITVEEHLQDGRKFAAKLSQLEGKHVSISINRAMDQSKNYGYQLVNSYFLDE